MQNIVKKRKGCILFQDTWYWQLPQLREKFLECQSALLCPCQKSMKDSNFWEFWPILWTTSFSSLINVPSLSTAAPSLSILDSFSQANLDSLSSQLDDNLWKTDVTSFPSKGSASLSITSSTNSSSASSARLRIICRSSNSPGSCVSPTWAAIFVFIFNWFPVSLRITHRPRAEWAFHRPFFSAPWLIEHRAAMREVVSSTPTGPTLRFFKDVRAKIFQHWFFSETFTTVRWWVSYVRNVKKMGGHRLRFGENMPGKTPKMWQNPASLANKASVCKPKYIAIKSVKWNLLCQILFKWTY